MTSFKVDQRFFDVHHEPQETLSPIQGYADMPFLSLKMSVENLNTIINKVSQNAHVATERSPHPNHGLTQDQSAAICLYTMNWKPIDQALSARLNGVLRSEDRAELVPYFFYLKLLLSALWKLKAVTKTVWRGVKADLSSEYPRGKTVTWWGFSSCVESFDEIESDRFVGRTGTRTLFQIECKTGRAINAHSFYHDINEVLLLPATQLEVVDQIYSENGLCVIRLREINASFSFLQTPFPSSTHTTSTKRTEQKICSAPLLPSTRDLTDSTAFLKSQSTNSLSSSNVHDIPIRMTKRATKPYENKLLKQLIKQERTKQSIRLSKQFFNYDDMEIVADELISNKSWTTMCLWDNCMNERHLRILMRALKMNTTMMCLSLDRNLLGDDGASVLASALKTNKCLRSIYLNGNHISDEGAKELSQMLDVNRTLTHLELSSNTIGDNGVGALSDALKVNRYLRTLCLNDNKMSMIGAQHLADMLEVNETLSDLRLSSNAVGDEGVISIIHALEQNNTLESLHIDQTMISTESMHTIKGMLKANSMLKCLYLNDNHLGDDGVILLCSALKRNTTLTTLDLSSNDLSEKSAKKLGDLLKETQTALTTLNIGHNAIGDQGVVWIAFALMKNTSLMKLMIDCVEMTVKGAHEIAVMLCSNTNLRYLALNNNDIDESGLKLLGDALEHNKSLEYLYLNKCNLNDECVPLIIEMMKHSKTLISIELVKNHLTEHGKIILNEASMRSKTCALYLDFTFH